MMKRPRNMLDPEDLGIIVFQSDDQSVSKAIAKIEEQGLLFFEMASDEKLPWQNSELCDLLEKPEWRQLLIVADRADTNRTALVLMALEKGFHTYFASPKQTGFDLSLQRLLQASAIVMSTEDLLRELNTI